MATRRVRIPHPLLATVVGVAVGLFFGYMAVDLWAANRALDERGQEAAGQVVQVRERVWPKNPRLEVEFTTADGTATQTWITAARDSDPKIGQQVRVRYDPRDLTNAVDARDDGPPAFWLFAVLAAVLLIGSPGVAWFMLRPARRALAERPGLAERVARVRQRGSADRPL